MPSPSSYLQPDWQAFRVTKRTHSGEIGDYLNVDDVVEISGTRVKVRGQEYHAPGLVKAGTRKNLFVPYTNEAPTAAPVAKTMLERALEAKHTSVALLPEGWAEMHWQVKVKFIGGCDDKAILKNITMSETRHVKAAAEARLEALESGDVAKPEVSAGEAPISGETPPSV